MKANELMIGDWVNATFLVLDGHPQKYTKLGTIDAINEGMIECEPIPLTAEILKTNGWEYFDEEDGWLNNKIDGNFYAPWENNPKWFLALSNDRLSNEFEFLYVHELQHALRLCGLNDLADNFKIE